MNKEIKYDENFLKKRCREVEINFKLPFKLQKRQLLEKLGFPVDNSILIPLRNYQRVQSIVKDHINETPAMIGIHTRPMETYHTPFLWVKEQQDNKIIEYQDESGNIKTIAREEIFQIIERLAPQSWLELTTPIWKRDTIAGRIIYFSPAKQILEIEKGVVPDQLGGKPGKLLNIEFSFFSYKPSIKDKGYSEKLHQPDFKRKKVDRIVTLLKKYKEGFRTLRRIANLPTLEFGYIEDRKLVVVDIDWPNQYQY